MAHVVKDRVQETSTTTGTGTFTLLGAVSGFQTFSSAIGNTNTTYYTIQNGAEWEVGIGTVGAGTLSRDTILESSNAGSAVNFSAGTKQVFCTYPAEKSVDLDTAQTLTNKTISGSSNTLSNIGNSSLTNSSITINGTPVSLGGSASVGTVTSVGVTAGTGISVSGSPVTGSGSITVTNTAPDQTVALTAGTGISVSGTYPNFTITNTSTSSGDVAGPASATDNAIARFDGTTGKIIQNSSVTIDDTTGTMTFTGSGARIRGAFGPTSSDPANAYFQTSRADETTFIGIIPNGTAGGVQLSLFNNSSVTNCGLGSLFYGTSSFQISSTRTGTGTFLPMRFDVGGSERLRITTNGGFSFGSGGTNHGTSGQVLTSNGDAPPSWTTISSSGTVTSITAGTGLTGGTITTSGTIAIDSTVTTLTGTQTLTNKTLTSPTVTGAILNDGYTEEVFAITDGASVVLNPNNGSIQTWTLGANRAPTVSGWNNGQSMTLMINNGANFTIDWTSVSGTLIPFIANSKFQDFGSSGTFTLTLPTGLQTGDIVIVGIGSGGSSPSLPSGWTTIHSTTSGTEFARTFYKEMGTTPDTSISITNTGVATVAFVVVVKQGNVSGITAAAATGTTGMPNPANLASVQAGSLVLAIGYLDDDNVASSVTAPSGYTLLGASQASTTGQTVMVAYTTAETAGTYDPGAFGGTGTDDWIGVTIAISGGAGVNWTTDNGYAPTLNDVGFTSVVLWEVGDVIYGARVGNK